MPEPENPNSSPPVPAGSAPPGPTESQTSPEPAKPGHKHGRTGNIARLPKDLRDQVCEMILDGFTHRQIIEKLGDAGKHLSESHITTWKTEGGYDEWLLEMQRVDDLGATRDAALSLVQQKAGATVQDAGRTIASAQLYELLLSFDPRSFASALADKPELYFRLINALARLSEGEAVCSRLRAQAIAIERQLQTSPSGQASPVVSAENLKEIVRLIKLL